MKLAVLVIASISLVAIGFLLVRSGDSMFSSRRR